MITIVPHESPRIIIELGAINRAHLEMRIFLLTPF